MRRPRKGTISWLAFFGAASFFLAAPAIAHDLPLSYVDLRVTEEGIVASVESSAKNFARQLPGLEAETLLRESEQQRESLSALDSRLQITADGEVLQAKLGAIEPLLSRQDLRLQLHFAWSRPADTIKVRCGLFSSDPRHKTFLNLYQGATLRYQGIFEHDTGELACVLSDRQGIGAVIRQFVREGVHHIFIGPDHILFVVGLLLLGGTLGQLLKIVTAFTLAHSVTLILATLDILTPPARIIEPAIALSIIFVGAHALLRRDQKHDWRLLFAFAFGFVHGFGFANVLREMQLPRGALGWSLFSFNMGVEIGQTFIVLAVAPVLALLYRRSPAAANRIVAAGSFCIVFAGAYWFAERVFTAP